MLGRVNTDRRAWRLAGGVGFVTVGLLHGAAYAQEPADDHGNDRLDSTRIEHYGVSQTGRLETMGDRDVFRLDLQGRAEIEMRSSGALDTQGRLLDSEGEVLAEDDDGGTDLNFRIVQTLEGGVYYVEVASNMDVGDYKMTARIRRAGDDHGDTSGASTLLPLGIRNTGRIAPADDTDTFRIEVSETTGLRVSTGGPTDTAGELRDSNDAVLTMSDHGAIQNNFQIERHVEPGTYYVHVTAAAVGSFTVLAELYESDGPDDHDDHGDEGHGEDEPEESAWDVFVASISQPIVQARCVNCHVADGTGSPALRFVTSSNADHEMTNFEQFESFVAAGHDGHDHEDNDNVTWILDKIRGLANHGGGLQVDDGSQEFMDMERFLNLLAEEVADG
ncbi:MAG: PPC domain-containing protein [Gammaproteobacteria bacterium]|nr:PPC domain-containing protein [Gammaproteobacteria bacterium]